MIFRYNNISIDNKNKNRQVELHQIKISVQQRKQPTENTKIYKANINKPKRRFSILLTTMDVWSGQKMNKETPALFDTLDKMNSTDVYRTFYPNASVYTVFPSVH